MKYKVKGEDHKEYIYYRNREMLIQDFIAENEDVLNQYLDDTKMQEDLRYVKKVELSIKISCLAYERHLTEESSF